MGSSSSRLRGCVAKGDEYAAMQLAHRVDANASLGAQHLHDTPMHLAAAHAMKHLLRALLHERDGDPNKRNANDETVLHAACRPQPSTAVCVDERRAACVALLLQWRSSAADRVLLDARDRDGGTPLHLAAAAGLLAGVRLLLAAGARTHLRDRQGRSAAQSAAAAGHARIALLLQRATLFSDEPVDWRSDRWGWTASELAEDEADDGLDAWTLVDAHQGLRPLELREAKDRLLVDTSDMLRVSLFTAEALLRDSEWCRDALVERWMRDASACCQSAGVPLPAGSLDSEHPDEAPPSSTVECGICREEVRAQDAGGGGCGHSFCSKCWARYLRARVCDGDSRPPCPAPACRRPVPPHLFQRCLTPTTTRKYLQFDIKAFVESSRGMKWCPVAGCGRAVKLHEAELSIPPVESADGDRPSAAGYPPVSRGVDCGDFHLFCWDCDEEPHAPVACASWLRWLSRAGAAPPAPLPAAAGGADSAASSLWLSAHCKPCPSCSCPIQKNDGCNHMKCTKCKFDFCWICLDSWKRHGTATGGYFRCTREEATARAEQTRGSAVAEARLHNLEAQEQWRFAVQCSRFRRHEQSWLQERSVLAGVQSKAKSLDPTNSSNGAIHDAARVLGLCRRVLMGCCAYTFILPLTAAHRAAFFYAQDELERCTARLANLVAGEVVDSPLIVLRRATAAAHRWRLTALRLTRPPPPPGALSCQELRTMARLLARGRLDPRDPWRFPLGPRGEPLRVSDPFQPDQQIQQEPQAVVGDLDRERATSSNDTDVYRINVSEYNMDLIIALEMSRLQMLEEQARRVQETDGSSTSQESTLTRNRQRPARLNISVSIGASSDKEDKSLSDDQLKLAIQLSLQEPTAHSSNKCDDDINMRMIDCSTSQLRDNERGASWSITKERRDVSQDLDNYKGPQQDESWSRAADITVGCFLKALGRAPLEIPNVAVGLDLIEKKERVSPLSREGVKSRPPLLRSEETTHRTPSLRQISGKVRRSWSMSDISAKSSTTDDTTVCSNFGDEAVQTRECDFPTEQVHVYKSTKIHVTSVTKGLQTDDVQDAQESKVIYSSRKEKNSLKANKENMACRKKPATLPKNLPWGEFCCEKKCIKTNSPKKEAAKSDQRKPKADMATLAINKSVALLAVNELDGIAFRRHSDHIPRCSDAKREVKASSSEKNIRTEHQHKLTPKRTAKGTPPILSIKIIDDNNVLSVNGPSLETDSSNECESETGIPKSPTLYISGVSICRDSRASPSLVPVPSLPTSPVSKGVHKGWSASLGRLTDRPPFRANFKSTSANEPRRDREMFRFPKSSTDGALSSVLHVHESNLSSDDFHEALFLLEASPKTRDSKRRKRARKRDLSAKRECSPTNDRDEVTSAL